MLALNFTKATACGNDFLIIRAPASLDLASATRSLCDRHNGVGADGVEWIMSEGRGSASARLFNLDGSEAEISGNGTRCVAAWLAEQDNSRNEFSVATKAGARACRLIARNGMAFQFETGMGVPMMGERTVLTVNGEQISGFPVNMGNPHFVVFARAFPQAWQAQAAAMGADAHFPQGANVELVRIAGPHEIEVRIFERGAGETSSSGTGSCASAAAALKAGLVMPPVTVVAPGGPQSIAVRGDEIFLAGPTRIVCRGEAFL